MGGDHVAIVRNLGRSLRKNCRVSSRVVDALIRRSEELPRIKVFIFESCLEILEM